MIDYNIEYHDVGTDSFFFRKHNDSFHPTVIFLANNRDSKSIRNYVENISAVYKNIGCSCVTLSYTLDSSMLQSDNRENEELQSDLLRVTADIYGILSENLILHEPIFFHCIGDEGVYVYSQISREFLTDYIVGVTLESFDLGHEANTNQLEQSVVEEENVSIVKQVFDYFVRRPYDAAKNFFTRAEPSETAKRLALLRPKWPELFLCEAHQVSLARSICYSRPPSSYRQKISKFSSYYSGQLAPPGLKYIFPKSYRHQLYSFIRRSCEESFKESEL